MKLINTYYYVNTSAEVEAILRDGFSDEYKDTTTGVRGVYVADAPGEPDPDYPDDQLLEITLPPQISVSQFEILGGKLKEGARWREFVVPAHLLNECAEIRSVPKITWDQKWKQWIDSQTKGLIESRGQPKGKTSDPEIIRQNAEAFEALAMGWLDSRTGKPANTILRRAVIYMILDYFDCDNSADLYYRDLLAAVEEKLRLLAIKFGGLKGLPRKKELGRN